MNRAFGEGAATARGILGLPLPAWNHNLMSQAVGDWDFRNLSNIWPKVESLFHEWGLGR